VSSILPNNAVIMVTGTSSGIGLELARKLWKSNYRIIITALPQSISLFDKEEFFENERFIIRSLDICDYSTIKRIIEEVNALWGGVDVLINNAGISYRSSLEEMSIEDEVKQMTVNYLGPSQLTRTILPTMRSKRFGKIINVSSVGGMMAMPTMSAYSASKFALEGASEALWYEMKPWNIHVSLIKPGFINSLAFKKVFYSTSLDMESSPYKAYYKNMTHFVEKLMTRSPDTSKSVAKKILKVMHKKNPRLHNPATWDAWIFHFLRRLLPRYFYHRLLYSSLPNIKTWLPSNSSNKG
jgi:short-subunit dehydrogenase